MGQMKQGVSEMCFGRHRHSATILRAKAASNKSSSHNRAAMRHPRGSSASSIKRFESVKVRRKRCLVKVNGIFTSSMDLMRTPVSSSSLDQFLCRHIVAFGLFNV